MQPVPEDERLAHLDILRGIALFGVLIVNLETLFRIPLLEHVFDKPTEHTRADGIVMAVVEAVFEFKAFTIFSFLFGIGLAIQAERAASRGQSGRAFLARRLGWFLVFGLVHMFGIWNGDILTLYAVCGLLTLPLLYSRTRSLALAGAACIAAPHVLPAALPIPSGSGAWAWISDARTVYATGGFVQISKFRWEETHALILPLLVSVLPRTVGVMLWGAAAWRSGVVREPGEHRMGMRRGVVAGGVLGIVASSLGVDWIASLLIAFTYVSVTLLVLTRDRASRLPGFAAVGRMALTNYLMQSVILGFVFYGYGLGLFGRLGAAWGAFIAIMLYATQLLFSRFWLRRFRFGPFEWIWRSLSYGSRQPLSR
jgi:uncharacterized protein